ncbi:MAG: hypothetical protein VYA69_03250 [Gemmatimonadota bacterium]|nr:hypothetical protein [Gemmatimonadota bacterium]
MDIVIVTGATGMVGSTIIYYFLSDETDYDVPVLIGDASKFSEATGWSPTYTWQETIAECLDCWRIQE